MPSPDEFLAPRLSIERLDTFVSRRGIVEALTAALPRLNGVVLDIGCGCRPYQPLLTSSLGITRVIGLDIKGSRHASAAQPPDLEWDGVTMPLASGSVDGAIATEVLHQCPQPDLLLAEAARVLKPGGLLFVSLPFLWPVHDAPDDHVRFTPFSLERLLGDAGFEQVHVSAPGGWDASLAQMIGLWVRRRPMRRLLRAALSRIARPIMQLLLKIDTRPDLTRPGGDTMMMTSLTATAINGRGRMD